MRCHRARPLYSVSWQVRSSAFASWPVWPPRCTTRGAVRDGRTGRELKPDRAGNPERTGLSLVRSCRTPETRVQASGKTDRSATILSRAAFGNLEVRPGADRNEWRKRDIHRSNVPSSSPRSSQHPDSVGRLRPPAIGRIVCATPGNRIPEINTTNGTNKGDSVRRITARQQGAWGTCRATRKS